MSQKSRGRARDMQRDIERDKSTGHFVVWLRFTPVMRDVSARGKEQIVEFLRGVLLPSSALSKCAEHCLLPVGSFDL